jgi:uncharacterized protein YdaU (DUF1376 family)
MVEIFCYQHHIGKYDDSTSGLSLIQHGAYCRLLQRYYKLVGKLPNDIRAICRMLSCQSKAERDAVAYAVAEFFTVGEDGFLRNRGAEKELQRITNVSEENRRKANLKWLKDKETRNAAALPEHMPRLCPEDANSSTHQLINSLKENIDGEKNEKAKRICAIPTDWKPNKRHIEKSEKARLSVEAESEKFRNYHEAKGNRFVNWDSAFNNWLLNAEKYLVNSSSKSNDTRSPFRKVL